jgi:hypothetical protein
MPTVSTAISRNLPRAVIRNCPRLPLAGSALFVNSWHDEVDNLVRSHDAPTEQGLNPETSV